MSLMSLNPTWICPPIKPVIVGNQVHIWRGVMPMQLDQFLTKQLSSDEIQRAARFLRTEDKQCSLFSHGMLRIIMSLYTEKEPQQLVFSKNSFGKPSILQSSLTKDIRFNMAHSKDVVLVAVTSRDEVGIDVEFIRDIQDAQTIVFRNFSLNEKNYLNQVSQEEFCDSFFTCWTLKEAFIKAIGQGLSCPLESFSVIDSEGKTISDWILLPKTSNEVCYQKSFSPSPEYKAAVAVKNMKPEPLFFAFN